MCTLDYSGVHSTYLLLTGGILDDSVDIPAYYWANHHHHRCRYILLDNCSNLFVWGLNPHKSNRQERIKSCGVFFRLYLYVYMLQVTICVYKQSGKRKGKRKRIWGGKFIGRVFFFVDERLSFFFVLRPSETPERVVSVVSRCETRHHMSGSEAFLREQLARL